MRIFSLILVMLFAHTAFANDDQDIRELFKKYALVMNGDEKLASDVFTEKFLSDNGGKAAFMKKIKSVPPEKMDLSGITWKKGASGKTIFAKIDKKATSEFLIQKENGKFKVNSTLSDAD